MTTKPPAMPASQDKTPDNGTLNYAIRDYVCSYALWHGRAKAAETFGVSRHTLWRCLERGRLGRALPRAVIKTAGDNPDAIAAAAWAMTASRQIQRRAADPKPLAENLEDTLRLLCAAPLSTAEELSSFGRVPATTLRRRLANLAERGLVDSVSHHLGALGPNPRRRHFPTERGIEAAARAEHGTERFLSEYPVSREWFRLLTERLDTVAALYHVAAMIAIADPQRQPVRVDHYRQGPYDLLITLSEVRSLGIVRQGPVLSSANLRYRLRTLENLRQRQRAHRHPGIDPLRSGHPPGLPHPGRTQRAPQHLRRHRGGTAGGRRRSPGVAAARRGRQLLPARGDQSRRVPGRHHGLAGTAGGERQRLPPEARP